MQLQGCNHANFIAVCGGRGDWRDLNRSRYTAGSTVKMRMRMVRVSGSAYRVECSMQAENIWRWSDWKVKREEEAVYISVNCSAPVLLQALWC